MKKTPLFLLTAVLLAALLPGCNRRTGSDTGDSSGSGISTPSSSTAPLSASTPGQTSGTAPTPAKTDEPTEPSDSTAADSPDPPDSPDLPGNPEKFAFAAKERGEYESWSEFGEGQPWTYLYTPQTGIGEAFDPSLLRPSEYDAATDSYLPAGGSVESGWSQKNDGSRTSLTPATGFSAVLAFTAPTDGCYLFEFSFNAGMRESTDSDGLTFFLFGDGRTVYSFHSEQVEIDGESESRRISLAKGDKAYFVADPLSSGTGDLCEYLSVQVTKMAKRYIDRQNAYAFGSLYDCGNREQGTDGWYVGYAATGSPLSPSALGDHPIPDCVAELGNLFGMISGEEGEDPDREGIVLWQAPGDGNYTVSVDVWTHGEVGIAFYCGDELITEINRETVGTVYTMTCPLKKGECFALVFTHSDSPKDDTVDELQILIEADEGHSAGD